MTEVDVSKIPSEEIPVLLKRLEAERAKRVSEGRAQAVENLKNAIKALHPFDTEADDARIELVDGLVADIRKAFNVGKKKPKKTSTKKPAGDKKKKGPIGKELRADILEHHANGESVADIARGIGRSEKAVQNVIDGQVKPQS